MAKNRNIDRGTLDIVKQYLQLSKAEESQNIDIDTYELSTTIIPLIRDSMLQKISLKSYQDGLLYFNAVFALKQIEEVGDYLEDGIISIKNELGKDLVFTKDSATKIKEEVEAQITPLNIKLELITYLYNQIDKNDTIYSEQQINEVLVEIFGYEQRDLLLQPDEEYLQELALNVHEAPNIIDPLEQYPNTKPVFSKLKNLSPNTIKKAAQPIHEYLAGKIDNDTFNANLSNKLLENYSQEEFYLIEQIFVTTTNCKDNHNANHGIPPAPAPRGVANKVKTIVQELSDSGLNFELIERAEPHIRAYLNGKTSYDTFANKLTGEFLQGDDLGDRILFVENVSAMTKKYKDTLNPPPIAPNTKMDLNDYDMSTMDLYNATIAENPNAFDKAPSTTTNRHMPQDMPEYLTKDTYDKNEVHNILVRYNREALNNKNVLFNTIFGRGDKKTYEIVSNLIKEYPYHTLKNIKSSLLKYIGDSKNEKYNVDTHPDSLLNTIEHYLIITKADEMVNETMYELFHSPNNKDSSMLITSVSKLLNYCGENKATDAINKYLSTCIQISKLEEWWSVTEFVTKHTQEINCEHVKFLVQKIEEYVKNKAAEGQSLQHDYPVDENTMEPLNHNEKNNQFNSMAEASYGEENFAERELSFAYNAFGTMNNDEGNNQFNSMAALSDGEEDLAARKHWDFEYNSNNFRTMNNDEKQSAKKETAIETAYKLEGIMHTKPKHYIAEFNTIASEALRKQDPNNVIDACLTYCTLETLQGLIDAMELYRGTILAVCKINIRPLIDKVQDRINYLQLQLEDDPVANNFASLHIPDPYHSVPNHYHDDDDYGDHVGLTGNGVHNYTV